MSRLPPNPSRKMLQPGWAAAAFVALTACGGIGLGSVTVGSTVEDGADGGSASEGGAIRIPKDTQTPPADSGTSTDAPTSASKYVGSPLCEVTTEGCDPDLAACIYDVADGGTPTCVVASICAGSSIPSASAACRVVETKAHVTPVCSATLGTQSEGTSCMQSSDCAAELECVGAHDANAGTCRHYCCGLSCDAPGAFCDIEPVYGAEQLVPVCAYGQTCTPLDQSCPDEENCTIVNAATGQTACVTPGTAVLGGDCTTAKCGKDLACIDKTCKQLCTSSSSYSCPSGESCVPLTALANGTGICTM
jgi:hypothetical protein